MASWYYQTTATSGITVAASSANSRTIDSGIIRPVIGVVGDIYIFTFGTVETPVANPTATGTAAGTFVIPCSPCVVGPQNVFTFYRYGASQTTEPIMEWTAAWVER